MKNKAALFLRLLLGCVFILSAYSKISAPGIVEIILVDHGIASTREIAAIFVRVLIGLELGLGFLLLQPFSLKRIVIPGAFLFLIIFTVYLGYTQIILHDTQNCGCFGEMIKMSPVESIIKNILLIGLLVILFKNVEERTNYFIVPLIPISAVVIVFLVSPVNSNNDFKFSKYTNFENAGRVDLSSGDKLIAIFNTECDHCQNLAKELSEIRMKEKWLPDLYVLEYTEGSVSADSFKVITKSNFPYRMIDMNEFLNLIGQSPPRIYWVHDGAVKKYWDKDAVKQLKQIFKLSRKK